MKLLDSSFKASLAIAGSALTAFLVTLPLNVQAFSLVTDRADLGANDQIDWSSLGFTPPFKVLPYSFSAASAAGLGLQVQIPPTAPPITPPLAFPTAPPPLGIPTNFASSDFLLFTGLTPGVFPSPGNPGPLTILFNQPVSGAGAQIAVDDTTLFTAFISAYDSANTLLGTFSAPGTSSLALDNSAIFLGVSSDTANISKIVYSTSIPDRGLAINTLSINSSNNAAVPEPSTILAIGLAGVGLLTARKRVRA